MRKRFRRSIAFIFYTPLTVGVPVNLDVWYTVLKMRKFVKPLNQLTKLEQEKQSRIMAEELAEEIDTLGQDSEIQAAKWVIEKGKEEEHQESEKEAEATWKLDESKNQYSLYRERIYKEAKRQLETFDVPRGFRFDVALNENGLVFCFQTPLGKVFARGMKISTFVAEDLQGVTRMIHDALDQMEKMEEDAKEGQRTPSGIYIP